MKPFFYLLFFLIYPFFLWAQVASPPVILSELGIKNLGLETTLVEEASFEMTTFALGQTHAIPEQRAALSSRIPGRVSEIRLSIGSFVEKGDKLVLVESLQAGNPPMQVWLTAPRSGTILSVNTKLGAAVETSESLAEIADLKTLYLIVRLPQAMAGKIPADAIAKVRFPIRPGKEYQATRLKFTACPCPDPACALGQDISTHSEKSESADLNAAGVIFTMENPDNQLRPEMTAESSIVLEKRENVLSVPKEAVHGGPSNRHVFVKHISLPHAYERVSVQTGMRSEDRIEIVDGLLPGDEVATRGSYSLGFIGNGSGVSLKEAMDAAHGHEHNEDGSEMTPEQEASHGKADDHHDHEHGMSMREKLLIASTSILSLLMILNFFMNRSLTSKKS